MSTDLSLTANMEDYLEAIDAIGRKKKVVRVKDIAKYLEVKMASVSGALKGLVKKGLVNHESYEYVELTQQGKQIAQEIVKKHEVLYRFLVDVLGIDEKSAQKEACQMEHTIGKQAMIRLIKFLSFLSACPKGGPPCLNRFKTAMETGELNIVCPFSGETINVSASSEVENKGVNKKMGKKVSEMNYDEEGTIKEIEEGLKPQLAGMGIRVGKKIKMLTKQPIKGPVVVEVDRANSSFGLGIADGITVEVENG